MRDPFARPEKQPAVERLAYPESELAAALGVSVRTLFNWRQQGLPYVWVNGRPLYLAESVKGWLKDREIRHGSSVQAAETNALSSAEAGHEALPR